ncbi:MAG: transglycosylase domain-containing protein, partial [Flavobacteriaceae bacterium]|nr:transglycosylase domain-containing protein [Flavobacteriaceae bacterium]
MKVLLIGQNWLRKQIHKKRFWILLVLAIWYVFCLPKSLFKQPHSTVVFDAQGTLLGAKIATDGQWRFPQLDSLPQKYKTAVLQFEDAYFYQHPGVNPVSIVKALATNIQAGRVLRGGSTITQQVIRLSRQQPRRTYAEKILEMILASRLELRFSKEDILKLYASHAPFGGNVVGLDMAAWRYFGRSPFELSWAECATLAVLPNAPSLIFPGKNQKHLLNKRNRLLQKLYQEGYLDQLDYTLAIAEELPQKPYKIPRRSPHLVEKLYIQNPGKKHYTHIHGPLQDQLAEIAKKNYKQLSQNQIHNLAILVIDVKTRAVEAYIGNAPTDSIHQKDVNMIHALRSTGSILKPFLYSALLDAGTILPKTLV